MRCRCFVSIAGEFTYTSGTDRSGSGHSGTFDQLFGGFHAGIGFVSDVARSVRLDRPGWIEEHRAHPFRSGAEDDAEAAADRQICTGWPAHAMVYTTPPAR